MLGKRVPALPRCPRGEMSLRLANLQVSRPRAGQAAQPGPGGGAEGCVARGPAGRVLAWPAGPSGLIRHSSSYLLGKLFRRGPPAHQPASPPRHRASITARPPPRSQECKLLNFSFIIPANISILKIGSLNQTYFKSHGIKNFHVSPWLLANFPAFPSPATRAVSGCRLARGGEVAFNYALISPSARGRTAPEASAEATHGPVRRSADGAMQ